MRPLRNIIYIQTQGAWLNKEGENLVMNLDGQVKARVPMHKLQGVVCFGQVSVSHYLMAHCAESGITITHLNQYGRFLARVEGKVSGNVLLRRMQYRLCDKSDQALVIAQGMVTGKVYNQRAVIRRFIRDHKDKTDPTQLKALKTIDKRLTQCLHQINFTTDIPQLMGREGESGAQYFSGFKYLILNQEFNFTQRIKRHAQDPVNALMSFMYTLITHDCRSALETTGLDPQCGFLHQLRPGRPSLALDLVEEFRPIVDRFVLSLINKKQIGIKDFECLGDAAVTLKEMARRTVLGAWQDRKQDNIMHPWFEETVPLGLLPWLQAQILARHLRGDCDAYIPFLWK